MAMVPPVFFMNLVHRKPDRIEPLGSATVSLKGDRAGTASAVTFARPPTKGSSLVVFAPPEMETAPDGLVRTAETSWKPNSCEGLMTAMLTLRF
jgi:hypothetical protein